jgi:SAM-dependent methyltransferase
MSQVAGRAPAAPYLRDLSRLRHVRDRIDRSTRRRSTSRHSPATRTCPPGTSAGSSGAETFGAIVAFYSLIHLEPTDFGAALREIRRVLQPRGVLLAAFHRGSERVHLDDWWGTSVDLDFQFYEPDQVCRPSLMRGSGSSG